MELQPGESYSVQVAVTNKSLYLSEPVAADLTIAIEAALNGVVLIPYDTFGEWFEPDEAKTYAWSLEVPADIPTSSGAIIVEVRCPDGGKLAEASVDIHVESVDPGELRITEIFLADPNNVNEPGRGIWSVVEGVVPDGREFWVRTVARRIAPSVGAHGKTGGLSFFNGVPRYMSVSLRSGYTYEAIEIDIWDYQGGPLLASRRLDFDPPYYQE